MMAQTAANALKVKELEQQLAQTRGELQTQKELNEKWLQENKMEVGSQAQTGRGQRPGHRHQMSEDARLSRLDLWRGALLALWFSFIVIGAINDIPLKPKLLEFVGLYYSGWFVYWYFFLCQARSNWQHTFKK
ncbi:hypothetical protein L7F22_026456 [Adiantum nelumboides]|nr:hypothetical protein [Adiantum nelumboides]